MFHSETCSHHVVYSTVRIIIKTWLVMHDQTYLKMYRNVPTCSLSFAQKCAKVGGWSKQEVGEKSKLELPGNKIFQIKCETGFTTFTAPTS